ncbi:hypothetical protein [Geomicrobium sp. JCM 19039]|uniref:hypothetical protein n=1 Tax=Geomicrobium sp. JCM 19039 TaxID=1460636 RepID=UPI00045F333F|nr:hypothetical protein [Geomicrobium sp. JCM 19039]GAK14341.1 hypothetical protein JCM19039_4253 [Geomicrobium sp. JCM 19039]
METLLGIIMTVLPLLIVAVLVVFVIKRLAKKAKEESFTHADNQRALFMPFGMLIGTSVGYYSVCSFLFQWEPCLR